MDPEKIIAQMISTNEQFEEQVYSLWNDLGDGGKRLIYETCSERITKAREADNLTEFFISIAAHLMISKMIERGVRQSNG